MQYRPIGNSGIQASVVGFGCWALGGWLWGGTDEDAGIDAIHAAIDAGITLIDTAPVYGFGVSEEIVGKAIAGKRDKIILATKCGLVWNTDKGEFNFYSDERGITKETGKYKVHRYLSPASIRDEIEKSLKRLGTDYIDLYQTHWQDTTTPIEETMAELLKLKAEGKIRAIGVSNVNLDQIKQYCDVKTIDSDQEKFSMIDRKIEAELLPFCMKKNISMLAYSPMERGLLSGKIGPGREFNDGDMRKRDRRFTPEGLQKISDMLGEFTPLTEKYNISIAQLVVAWTFHYSGVTHVLVGGRRPEQAIENAAAGNVKLTDEEVASINDCVVKYM